MGVCRPTVRNRLEPGDAVVFFAADRLHERRPARYWFVGYATVDYLVRQTDIFTKTKLKRYRNYANLLITRQAGQFVHFERELPQTEWHWDWLWRICVRAGFVAADVNERRRPLRSIPNTVRGRRVRIAPNYVIFHGEPDRTFVVRKPPLIATVANGGRVERWQSTPFALDLKAFLHQYTKRHLRTTNRQRAHPPIVIDTDVDRFLRQLRRLCKRHDLRRRRLVVRETSRVKTTKRTSSRGC